MTLLKHITYLRICDDYSILSKCAKHKVGSLIVKNDRIISNGVNGTPSGYTNCCDKFHGLDTKQEPYRSEHKNWAEIYEVHAEMNAILFAVKNGVDINGGILYCNLEPCFNCLKHAISAGIKEIYYSKKHKYNLDSPEAQNLINTLGIKIKHIEI